MTRDWLQWHEGYDSPTSSLARRLRVVQANLRRALAEGPCEQDGTRRLISMCAGDGRDVLPVLAECQNPAAVHALLVELDPTLARAARAAAAALGLSAVTVEATDAGTTDPYLVAAPAHIVLACGVFGNITSDDAQRTIALLPSLLVDDGLLIWTRGRSDDGTDPSLDVRTCLNAQGFAEVAFTRPDDARFRVGMHRLSRQPAKAAALCPGMRLFTFF